MTNSFPLRSLFDESYYSSQFRSQADVGNDPFKHYMTVGWKEGRKPHRLLDTEKYFAQYPDAVAATTNPLQHFVDVVLPVLKPEFDPEFYLQEIGGTKLDVDLLWHYCVVGWRQGMDPSQNFSAAAYLNANGDVQKVGVEPFFHWIIHGRKEGRAFTSSNRHIRAIISPKFDPKFYLKQQPHLSKSNIDLVNHYIVHGWREGFDPRADFSVKGYLDLYPDVKQSGVEPFFHWLTKGAKEKRDTLPSISQVAATIAPRFNADFYLACHPSLTGSKDDLIQHYLLKGWEEGFDPRPDFSSTGYLNLNPDVKENGVEPFYHWITRGINEDRQTTPSLYNVKAKKRILHENEAKRATRNFFDANYYLKTYDDLHGLKIDPFEHYMEVGWKEGRNPNPEFNSSEYLNRHPDVDASGMNPLSHYALIGKEEGRSLGVVSEIAARIVEQQRREILSYSNEEIFRRAQDMTFPADVLNAEKLMLFVIPEHNSMSGGIYSMFSIASQMRRMKREHGYEIMVATRPNASNTTYLRNSSFVNSETVYRFEQLELCRKVRELYLHIPEYAVTEFVRSLSHDMLKYLMRRGALHVNILNQNIRLMPERDKFRDLRRLTDSLGQSVAHHAYATQERAFRYDLPTLLVPAYTDLSNYAPASFEEKENLIIYSPDDAPYKDACVERMREALPDYKLVEINGITFDKYMDLATRCKFSVSFGEGFDGYVAQPIYQGGIGFALYTDEFFPSDAFLKFENFFPSEQAMTESLVDKIRALGSNRTRYVALNTALHTEWDKLYVYSEYLAQLKKLALRRYEIFPYSPSVSTKPPAQKLNVRRA